MHTRKIKFPDEVNLVPETPGVYQFRDDQDAIIYIGKAKNLKNRIKSYTASDLLLKTEKMVASARFLTYIEVQSEFEALLLEARLVRKYMPLYNIELKDDKSPLYIGITNEEFPRVLTFRQTDLREQDLKYEFGPYIDGRSTKYILRELRKVFPYSQHRVGKRGCIYSEIGLCNPCPSVIVHTEDEKLREKLKQEYMHNLQSLISVLRGKTKTVSKELYSQIKNYSDQENYEEAQNVKKRYQALLSVTAPSIKVEGYIENPNFVDDIRSKELAELESLIKQKVPLLTESLRRIECFDIAHLSGSNPTASMVTFINATPEKKFYRHFKINKGKRQNNDTKSMHEVLNRRIKHLEDWGTPDLIIIDGGKPQIAEAFEVLNGKVPFVGLAKRYETLVFFDGLNFSEKLLSDGGAKNLVVRMRNEAHRFARRLHHNLVTKTLLGSV